MSWKYAVLREDEEVRKFYLLKDKNSKYPLGQKGFYFWEITYLSKRTNSFFEPNYSFVFNNERSDISFLPIEFFTHDYE